MSVPKDQNLVLTIFTGIFLFSALLFWVFLPANISPYSEMDDEEEVVTVLGPEESVVAAEAMLIQAEAAILKLEKEAEEKDKEESPERGSDQ